MDEGRKSLAQINQVSTSIVAGFWIAVLVDVHAVKGRLLQYTLVLGQQMLAPGRVRAGVHNHQKIFKPDGGAVGVEKAPVRVSLVERDGRAIDGSVGHGGRVTGVGRLDEGSNGLQGEPPSQRVEVVIGRW